MTQSSPPPPSQPAGWYDDPEAPGRRRYWDGEAWSDKVAVKRPTEGLYMAGLLTAFLVPLAGLVIGIILMAKDDDRGVWVLVWSIVMTAAYTVLVVA